MKTPEKFYLEPVEGRRVKDPETFKVLSAGDWKPKTNYWQRRLRDGDVTEGTPPAPAEPKSSRRSRNATPSEE